MTDSISNRAASRPVGLSAFTRMLSTTPRGFVSRDMGERDGAMARLSSEKKNSFPWGSRMPITSKGMLSIRTVRPMGSRAPKSFSAAGLNDSMRPLPGASVSIPPAVEPGDYSGGFAVPWLGGVRPLALESLTQFDPGAPPAIPYRFPSFANVSARRRGIMIGFPRFLTFFVSGSMEKS